MKNIAISIFVILFSGAIQAQSMQYIQSNKAKLLSQPSFKADVVVTLTKGAQVTVLKTNGRWIQVSHAQAIGWVSSLLLSKNAPIDKQSVLATSKTSLKEKARRRASDNTTAAATRGLRTDNRARASDQGHADYKALDQMESLNISEPEITQFSQELQQAQ